MTIAEVLADALSRVQQVVHEVVTGLSPDQLAYRPDPSANSIGWLVWHLTRAQDDHVADAAGTEQVWLADGWSDRFGLPFDSRATGWSQTADEVGAFRVADGELLTGYHDAVYARTLDFVGSLTESDLDRVVDTRWDPPVTLGVRLVSVIDDDAQHAGQAAYLRGLITPG